MDVVMRIDQADDELVGPIPDIGKLRNGAGVRTGQASCTGQEHAAGRARRHKGRFSAGERGDASTGLFVQLVEMDELARRFGHRLDHGRGHDGAAECGDGAAGVDEGAQA